mgnify:FL=1
MTKAEINTFIETMEEFGDIWTADQEEEVYGNSTLDEAIADRRSSHEKMADLIGKVINR